MSTMALQPMKLVRTFICPDRESDSLPTSRSRDDGDECAPPPPKRHCQACLNTNLIDIAAVNSIVKVMLKSCCRQCGKLWSLIPSRQDHDDMHVRECSSKISRTLKSGLLSTSRADQLLQSTAYKCFMDSVSSGETGRDLPTTVPLMDPRLTRFASSFVRMSDQQKKFFTDIASSTMSRDRALYDNTAMEGCVDDRPSLDVHSLHHPLHSDITCGHFSLADFFTLDYCNNVWGECRSDHVVYQVDPPLDSDDWGNQDYVCYLCTDDLKITLDCSHDERPILTGCKVCTCSIHCEETDGSDKPVLCADTQSTQIAVTTRCAVDNKFYLYTVNSMFSGYVIHNGCCAMFYKKMITNK